MSGGNPGGAPKFYRALASLLVRGRDAESILDDLDAIWSRDVQGGLSRPRAALRYGSNALGSALSVWGEAMRDGRRGGFAALASDLRMAVRSLAQQRAFFVTAVATLAIGIGATTAIFSALNSVLLKPLAYRSADDIYAFNAPRVDGRWATGRVAHAYVAAIEETSPSVERAVAVTSREDLVFAEDGETLVVLTQLVTQGFFDVFDVPMMAGRAFVDEDYESNTAVISSGVWQRVFGASPDAVGQVLHMGQGDYTVVGVAPADLGEPVAGDVWISFRLRPTNLAHSFEGYLRTAPDTDPELLDEELAGTLAGVVEAYPQAAEGRAFVAQPVLASIVGNLGPILLVIMCGAGVVLLLASVNVAILVLARGRILQREVAVRTALGAGRVDLLRRLLAESLVVAGAGTLGGLALAWLGARLLSGYGASQLPRLDALTFDSNVLLVSVLLLGSTTLLAGLAPSLRLLGTDVRGVLGDAGRSASASRATNRLFGGFVVCEIALAILLVSGAGWMVRNYGELSGTSLGYAPERRLVFTAFLTGTEWAPDDLPVQQPERWVNDVSPGLSPAVWASAVRERLSASDQVRSVGSAGTLPLNRNWEAAYFVSIAGDPFDADAAQATQFRAVDPSFFPAMGASVVEGRVFELDEPAVALVNESFVRRYIGGRDPLEQALHFGFPTPNLDRPYAIVGVVENMKYESLVGEVEPTFYLPFAGARQSVVVETTLADPTPLIPSVRAEVAAVDPDVPVTVVPYEEIVGTHLVRQRMGLSLMSLFALVSIVMATVGIYGVVAYLMSQRTREIATRMAFGAAPSDVRGLLLRRSALLASAGAVLGLGLTWVGGRFVAALLPDLATRDPAILAMSTGIVLALVLLAVLSPTVRASRMEPAEGLSDTGH